MSVSLSLFLASHRSNFLQPSKKWPISFLLSMLFWCPYCAVCCCVSGHTTYLYFIICFRPEICTWLCSDMRTIVIDRNEKKKRITLTEKRCVCMCVVFQSSLESLIMSFSSFYHAEISLPFSSHHLVGHIFIFITIWLSFIFRAFSIEKFSSSRQLSFSYRFFSLLFDFELRTTCYWDDKFPLRLLNREKTQIVMEILKAGKTKFSSSIFKILRNHFALVRKCEEACEKWNNIKFHLTFPFVLSSAFARSSFRHKFCFSWIFCFYFFCSRRISHFFSLRLRRRNEAMKKYKLK